MIHDGAAQQPLRILVVNPDVPPADRDSGSLRLFRLIEMMLAAGHSVSLLARNGLGERQSEAAQALHELGVSQITTFDLERAAAINPAWARIGSVFPPVDIPRLLREGAFDVAWLSFFHIAEQYAPLIRTHSPATQIVVDSVDIHHIREARGAALANDEHGIAAAAQTRVREQAAYTLADANLAVSETDAAHLRKLAPDVPVYVISNVHPIPERVTGLDDRADVLFVGNFRHAPNVDAVLWFHTRCWPLVRSAFPGAHLRIVGTEPPEVLTQMAAPDVTVEGWVPSIEPYLERARVSIAPLRYGAGVKGKIGEAMAAGVPVVTTSIGNEGMGMTHGEQAMIADSPEEFAAAVVTLLREDAVWERLSQAGRSLITRTLGVEASCEALAALLRDLCPVRWQAPADAPWLADLLTTYTARYGAGDRALLVLTYQAQNEEAGEATLARVSELADELGLDLDAVADIEITAWHDGFAVPSRTVFWEPERSPHDASQTVQNDPQLPSAGK